MEDFSTLLLGETGTGKGAVAAAIGRSGYIPFDVKKNCFVASFTKSFVSINLSAYADALIESELFGHKKGAFTGAIDNFSGVFERCSRYGSIFLDEVGEVSLPLQVKLLNVLQERQFTPVGSHSQQRFEGRVIAATNKSLDDLRSRGEFRNDFYYRLCSDVITLPTLRQRIAEEPREFELILKHVISKTLGRDDKSMSQKLVQMVKTEIPKDYPWPGNVRELEQCIRRLVVSGYYGGEDLPKTPLDTNISALVDAGKVSAHDLLSTYCRQLYAIHGSYEEVARIASLDRRTVKKYIVQN
jgi:transcriptional regulator with PAS, ATPase and Fis domain